MSLIVIGGQKGGTGKSTLATNLAVALTLRGRQVLLVDTDPQQTASYWAEERQSHSELAPITCNQMKGKVGGYLRDMAQRYDDVLVDAGGYDSVELRTALTAAHVLYTPVRPSQSDLWTLHAMSELVSRSRELNERLEAHVVLSLAPTNPSVQEAAQASELLLQYPAFSLCPHVLRDRKAWRDAMAEGRGVLEFSDPRARAEITSFTDGILDAHVQEAVA